MTPLGDPARRHTSAHNHTPPRYHKYYTVDKLFGIVILFLLYYCWVSSSPRMIDPLNSYLYVCLYIYLTCIYSLSRSINRILLDSCYFCILLQVLQCQLYFNCIIIITITNISIIIYQLLAKQSSYDDTSSNPVLMNRRYPYVSTKQLGRWTTETGDSFRWRRKAAPTHVTTALLGSP